MEDRRVHHRPALEQQPAVLEQAPHEVEHLLGELMALQEMPEMEDGRLVGDRVLAQFDADEAPHGIAVVNGVLGRRVRQVVPVLEEVDAQHPLERHRPPPAGARGVVRRDQRPQLDPGDHGVHLGEEQFAAGLFLLPAPREPGERVLLSHEVLGGGVRVTVGYRDHPDAAIPISELP